MLTTKDYWKLANHVHFRDPSSGVNPPHGTFVCNRAESSRSFFSTKANRNGFQAAVYTHAASGERVLALAGTQGWALNDVLADLRILIHEMPRQASSALRFFNSAINPNDNVVIVGHSLGGGLAQVLGYWTNRPFLTFNGPGMASLLATARINFLKPQVMSRTRAAKKVWQSHQGSRGLNIRVEEDSVSKFGRHVGDVTVIGYAGGNRHADLPAHLQAHQVGGVPLWNQDPFAVL